MCLQLTPHLCPEEQQNLSRTLPLARARPRHNSSLKPARRGRPPQVARGDTPEVPGGEGKVEPRRGAWREL